MKKRYCYACGKLEKIHKDGARYDIKTGKRSVWYSCENLSCKLNEKVIWWTRHISGGEF